MPLKEGIYRPASLLLLARAVGDQTRASALPQLTFSSKELRLPSTLALAEGSASLMRAGANMTALSRAGRAQHTDAGVPSSSVVICRPT